MFQRCRLCLEALLCSQLDWGCLVGPKQTSEKRSGFTLSPVCLEDADLMEGQAEAVWAVLDQQALLSLGQVSSSIVVPQTCNRLPEQSHLQETP